MSQDATTDYAPPQPTAEHELLTTHAGVWDVDCTFYMDPSQPPMQVKARETVEMFGPFWTSSVFECEMFGAPYKGHCTVGYDPQSQRYVSTWIDTMSPTFFHFTGAFDAAGRVLEMSGRAYDCMFKRETDYRTREEHVGRDERIFEMFMRLPDGKEVKMFTHHYRRAK